MRIKPILFVVGTLVPENLFRGWGEAIGNREQGTGNREQGTGNSFNPLLGEDFAMEFRRFC
jgi:hypothetical protein